MNKNDENNIINNNDENNFINNNDENHNDENHNDENHKDKENHNDENIDENNNRTLIVGPSFCGKTHLLINKLQLFRLCDTKKQIKIITRSPEQYENIQLEDTEGQQRGISVEEDLEDRTIQDFQNCCVVFDMLDSFQKLKDPFFTRGRHNDLDV